MVKKRKDKFEKGFKAKLERAKREEPKAESRVPYIPAREPQNVGRSKFKVAAKRRHVADRLAGVVHTAENPLSTRRVARPQAQPEQTLKKPVEITRPAQRTPAEGKLDLNDKERRCKRRPTSRKKGTGASRPFVPWCG